MANATMTNDSPKRWTVSIQTPGSFDFSPAMAQPTESENGQSDSPKSRNSSRMRNSHQCAETVLSAGLPTFEYRKQQSGNGKVTMVSLTPEPMGRPLPTSKRFQWYRRPNCFQVRSAFPGEPPTTPRGGNEIKGTTSCRPPAVRTPNAGEGRERIGIQTEKWAAIRIEIIWFVVGYHIRWRFGTTPTIDSRCSFSASAPVNRWPDCLHSPTSVPRWQWHRKVPAGTTRRTGGLMQW